MGAEGWLCALLYGTLFEGPEHPWVLVSSGFGNQSQMDIEGWP